MVSPEGEPVALLTGNAAGSLDIKGPTSI